MSSVCVRPMEIISAGVRLFGRQILASANRSRASSQTRKAAGQPHGDPGRAAQQGEGRDSGGDIGRAELHVEGRGHDEGGERNRRGPDAPAR